MNQSEQAQWIRIFDVPVTKLHKDGYTVYKIISTLLHRSFPEASTSLEVWRRYSAILKLHKEIIKVHNQFGIFESPPPYSKPSLINRFDEEVIEWRRNYTLVLLNYCAKYPSIYTSDQFTKFFQDDFGTKKKRLSFSKNNTKKSNVSLTSSSLGVSEDGLSLYDQLNDGSSSSEDLSGGILPSGEERRGLNVVPSVKHKIRRNESSQNENCQVTNSDFISYNNTTRPIPAGEPLSEAHLSVAFSSASHSNSVCLSDAQNKPFNELHSSQRRKNVSVNSNLKPLSSTHLPDETANSRRDVRKKTSEYIQKAEQLIAKFSLRDKVGQNSVKSTKSSSKERSLRSSTSFLEKYKVVGVSGNVIIAVDGATTETVAIKIVEKSSERNSRKPIFQSSVPFMVPLIRFYESEFAYYLILKYISGGKLWSHLKKFIKQPSKISTDNSLPVPISPSSTYEGQRLIYDEPEINKSNNGHQQILTDSAPDTDVSEMDQKSLSFSCRLAVAECKSSIEDYSSLPCPLDRNHHPLSLSNIIDIPFETSSYQLPLRDKLQSKSPSLPQSSSQGKSKSLDDLDSGAVGRGFKTELPKDDGDVSCLSNCSNNRNDNASIGSDTLSGVSEDFSSSSFNPVPYEDSSEQCQQDAESDVQSIMFESTFSRVKLETADNMSFDVNNLIKNSKKLLDDVNKTLEKSKRQIFRSFSSTKEKVETSNSSEDKSLYEKQGNNTANGNFFYTHPLSSFQTNPPALDANLTKYSYNMANPPVDSRVLRQNSQDIPNDHNINDSCSSNLSAYKTPLSSIPSKSHSNFCSISEINSENTFEDFKSYPSSSIAAANATGTLSMSSIEIHPSQLAGSQCHQIPEGLVRVWVSQVILAMDHLHQQGIIWGDFNPSNLLLDEGGSILVTYKYSFSGHSNTYERKGELSDWQTSQGYLAPELLNPVSEATHACDWWSVGALLFHLLVGNDVASCHPTGFTSHTQINFISLVSEEAASLISNLLCAHPKERLGTSSNGVLEIKDHPFFFGIEWPE